MFRRHASFPGRYALAPLMLLACSDTHQNTDAASAAAQVEPDAATPARLVKPRTVSIALFKTRERAIQRAADGSFEYGALTDLGGVKVCVARQRAAFASFQPFEIVDPPAPCTNSVAGEPVRLSGVPADADLVLTVTKDGYQAMALTFRTDANDQDAPQWGPSVSTALVRLGALDAWLETLPKPSPSNGLASVGAYLLWTGATPVPGGLLFGTDPIVNVAMAEGLTVSFAQADGGPVNELTTSRERDRWVSLAPGLYRFRFFHPKLHVRPNGIEAHFTTSGLPTDRLDTIEVPVLSGYRLLAAVSVECGAPVWGQEVEDLATCTLAPLRDAGVP